MSKIKTIVAGTTFGQFYLQALQYMREEFELCGILAGGSARSERLAKEFQVPIYRSVDELPEDIKLACVVIRSSALGGKGTEISIQLMKRGINVIQEQPLHHKELSECFKTAKKNGVFFHVGDLYVNLPAVRQFTAAAKELMKKQKVLYIEASCSTQVSYPLVDILNHIFPTIRPFKIKRVDNDSGPFHILTANIGKIPVIFLVHNEMNPDDPDNFMHLLQRITIGTTGGRLCLYDSHGPVVWHNRLHVPTALYNKDIFNQKLPDNLYQNSRYEIGEVPEMQYSHIIGTEWPKAVARDLSIYKELEDGKLKRALASSRELLAAEVWHSITNELGYASLRYGLEYEAVNVADLKAASQSEVGYSWIDEDRTLKKDEVDRFIRELDEAVGNTMLSCLNKNSCLILDGKGETLQEIMDRAKICPQFDYIIERWLIFLENIGYVEKKENRYFGKKLLSNQEMETSWAVVKRKWNRSFGSPLVMEYLIDNVKHIEELMRGEVNAANLLFKDGGMEYANALYAETVITKYLNNLIADIASGLAMEKKEIQILEVGAGTGSTSRKVAKKLAETGVDRINYCFSDVSEYFLKDARSYFKGYSFMNDYRIFDINRNTSGQGIPEESKDIIIAAGVLNNAVDTETTLKNLLSLLKKGGTLIVSEPTGEFSEMLVSQAFMIMRPTDERMETKTTFLTDEQWRNIIKRQGINDLSVYPEEGHVLENLRQKLYVIKK